MLSTGRDCAVICVVGHSDSVSLAVGRWASDGSTAGARSLGPVGPSSLHGVSDCGGLSGGSCSRTSSHRACPTTSVTQAFRAVKTPRDGKTQVSEGEKMPVPFP